MEARTLAVVLAAGKGTRMRSARPKVLHEVGGLSMIGHALRTAVRSGVERTALVVAPDATWADRLGGDAVTLHVQAEQRGTAHAVLAAREAFADTMDAVVVLFADTPLVRPATVDLLLERVLGGADIAVLAFRAEDPTGYGRVLLDEDGHLAAIREERDADTAERAVTLCNSGVMAIRGGAPTEALQAIGADNAKGEFYLTELVAIGAERSFNMVVEEAPFAEVMGINDRGQLALAEAEFQRRARADALAHATLLAPDTVYFSHDTVISEDALIEPYVVLGPGVAVGEGATVRAFSHLADTVVSPGAVIGPFARARGGSSIGPDAKVGNFVELKNATLASGVKVNHLSYVGDAGVGAGANIGAGTITCNYDGVDKHRTAIGEGAFIGSNSALVAPVSIGSRAFVGSGSVITEDVPDGALALGRGRQVVKDGRSPVKAKTTLS
ncbi:bifunctional UDP-N-acetylglucosamine diphosphorylase/glucosamine-1-phosphate N-acetyltransferase GlmU [Acuticoccus sp.]|uniref:bifunctional UDP-N-acetylglucosamine diphosphorylase/glucosamine-1-phosphate N-acetyltransferase GlmU n=1 Tax=Acuticoccus sp. TaxID=1904378 RepID=UPI003B519230